jgi:hypothetical protein
MELSGLLACLLAVCRALYDNQLHFGVCHHLVVAVIVHDFVFVIFRPFFYCPIKKLLSLCLIVKEHFANTLSAPRYTFVRVCLRPFHNRRVFMHVI